MQVLFLAWFVVAGMRDILWDGGLERDDPATAVTPASPDVTAAEGPDNPPPKP